MGQQIIKQPNGKFCLFSSIVDNITSYDLTEQDVIEEFVSEAKKEIENKVKGIIQELNAGGKPYFQFTKSYDEMLKTIKSIHGIDEYNQIKKAIESEL